MKAIKAFLMVLSLGSLGCERESRSAADADAVAPPPAMRMPGMEGMAAARAYLDSVAQAEPDELVAMAQHHRARMEQMLQAMDDDMRMMNMTADTAWRALADSVREDLRAIPEQRGQALVLRMRAHTGRMRRLLGMHERMMGPMEM